MNICILTCSTLSHQMGGTEVHCQILSEMAVQKGHSVTVITTKHPTGLEYEQKNGSDIYYLSDTRAARLSKSWWKESAKKIVLLHQKKPFDIIWAENLSDYYYAWKVKPLLKIPNISIIQGLGILGYIRSEWNRVSSFKELLSFTGKYLPEAFFFYIPWFFRTLKYSDAIVGVSDEAIAGLKKEFRIPAEKFSVIYNGIDTAIFAPDEHKREFIRKKLALGEKHKLLLMVGVIHKQKGMHIGLEAFVQIKKIIPEVKMIIVGDGPHLESLKKLVKELNIEDDVVFCGLIPNEETPFYYNAADLFFNPTLRFEGFCIVTIEAMSCGKPSVVSLIGGTKSTIDDRVNGFFVRPKDVKSLADKTVEILSNPLLAKRMGERAREKAFAKFSKEKMINDYLHISQKLIDEKRG